MIHEAARIVFLPALAGSVALALVCAAVVLA
jgi:hypothetical protein